MLSPMIHHYHRKRIYVLLLIGIVLIVILFGRLVLVQLLLPTNIAGTDLIKQAAHQRQQSVQIDSGRGDILDRNGHSFTREQKYGVAIFPHLKTGHIDMQKKSRLCELLSISVQRFDEQVQSMQDAFWIQDERGRVAIEPQLVHQINRLHMDGVVALPFVRRYSAGDRLAEHLVGAIGQNRQYVLDTFDSELSAGRLTKDEAVGVHGLEKTFQLFLQGNGPRQYAHVVDGGGTRLAGIPAAYIRPKNPYYPLHVHTTLDQTIQAKLETLLDDFKWSKGAAIVLDAHTSDIIAAASRPRKERTADGWIGWDNHVLNRFAPGSIFKIVIAAAALEEGLVDVNEQFQCNGILEGTDFHCWKPEGHGTLNVVEGFADSCNIVFGTLARRLGPDRMEEYAQRLGLTVENGWHDHQFFANQSFHQLDGEEVGQVFAAHRSLPERHDPEYLIRTGIGQLDVQVSPIAVANMLATIVRGGESKQVRAVDYLEFDRGGAFYRFKSTKLVEQKSISPYTAYQLRRMLAGVSEGGTARILSEKGLHAAGKTGTAEVESVGRSGAKQYHYWFAGYVPQNDPQYVIVTVALDEREQASNPAVHLFYELGRGIQ